MFSTFGYQNGYMLIATKVWSDFASNIPLIRSFSFGLNFPPQYPIFAGPPIHYHFLFYFLVGMLEKSGLRIDYALNIPSALGFFILLITIYLFAFNLFNSKSTALLSVLFFLFNGSLSFIYFLRDHLFSKLIVQQILTNQKFPSFGPYDQGIVSAFWNLNIYTNQRHLAAAYAFSLIIILIFLKPVLKNAKNNIKQNIFLGAVLGLSFYFHLPVLLMTGIILLGIFISFSKLRLPTTILIATTFILTFPQYLYLNSGASSSGFSLLLKQGYLVADNLTFFSFIRFWVYNLGLHSILIPFSLLIATKNLRKIFFSFFLLFIVGNIFQFSPEIAANHKFFNFFMIIGGMFSAYFIVTIWKKSKLIIKPFIIVAVFFLIFSGIIDFFPVYNDLKINVSDYKKDPDILWIINNTPPNSIFLNTGYIFEPASLAGRKIFLGWPYFSWSAGYDTTKRSEEIKKFFLTSNTKEMCSFLSKNNLSYISLGSPSPDFPFNLNYWQNNFNPIYKNKNTNYSIYSTKNVCQKK